MTCHVMRTKCVLWSGARTSAFATEITKERTVIIWVKLLMLYLRLTRINSYFLALFFTYIFLSTSYVISFFFRNIKCWCVVDILNTKSNVSSEGLSSQGNVNWTDIREIIMFLKFLKIYKFTRFLIHFTFLADEAKSLSSKRYFHFHFHFHFHIRTRTCI